MKRRQEKVKVLIQENLSRIIQEKVQDPRIGIVSITEVIISADLQHARVYISTLGDEIKKKKTLEGLKSATPFLRYELARRIRLRYIPEIKFEYDVFMERGEKVLKLLKDLKKDESDSGNNKGSEK